MTQLRVIEGRVKIIYPSGAVKDGGPCFAGVGLFDDSEEDMTVILASSQGIKVIETPPGAAVDLTQDLPLPPREEPSPRDTLLVSPAVEPLREDA